MHLILQLSLNIEQASEKINTYLMNESNQYYIILYYIILYLVAKYDFHNALLLFYGIILFYIHVQQIKGRKRGRVMLIEGVSVQCISI